MKAHRILTILATLVYAIGGSAAPPVGFIVGWGNDAARVNSGISFYTWAKPGAYTDAILALNAFSGTGPIYTNAIAVACGAFHGFALLSDGRVTEWGPAFAANQTEAADTLHPRRASGFVRIRREILSNVKAIAAGRTHSLAIIDDGRLVEWGQSDGPGGSPAPPPALSNVVAVSAGWDYNLALNSDGVVVDWPRSRIPLRLTNIVAVATGAAFYAPSLALTRDGTVFEWSPGGLADSVSARLTNVTAIAAGGGHCLALRFDGTVEGWGNNNLGQATGAPATNAPYRSEGPVTLHGQTLTNVIAIAAGSESSLALKRDGTVVTWGYLDHRPSAVPAGLSGVVAIAAGDNFCLAITTNAAAFTIKK